MQFIRRFDALALDALALAGGKGANLGEMTRAGLPVPPGFVLLTPAYRAFVAANRLQAEIERLAALDDGSSASIRAMFSRAPMPPPVVEAVQAAYA
jgi:phosphoenolpyruvate synthase/pyruvate phosphate dikinase